MVDFDKLIAKEIILKWAESDSKLSPEDLIEGLKAKVKPKEAESQ